MLSYITQTSLKLVVSNLEFVCDELVQHILRSDRFGT